MKTAKKLSIVSIVLCLSMMFCTPAFAITGTTFTSSGNNFIYADNPESFNLSPDSLVWLYGASLSTSYKDVEIYNRYWNAYLGTGLCRTGVALWNQSSSTATITYKGNSIAIDDGSTIGAINNCPSVLKNFLDSSYSTITLQPGEKRIVWSKDWQFKSDSCKFVYGRAQFKSSLSSGVWMRIFAAGQSKTADQIFDVATPAAVSGSFFCGELSYTQKNTTLSATSGNTTTFCEWAPHGITYNTNEYAGVISYKDGGLAVNAGNFGVIYNISVTNAAGKNIKITPRWDGIRPGASIVYSINNGPWTVGTTIYNGACWLKSIGTSSTANFRFLLPGGNGGNFDISFE